MCIVTGPNIDMAIKLIKRAKNIFETKLGLTFQNKETVRRVKRLSQGSIGLFYRIFKINSSSRKSRHNI